jgi:uncharacterized protein YqgC (DUF456 family)
VNLLLGVLAVAAMVLGLLLIPLGLPGLWLMVGVLAVATVAGAVGWPTLVAMVVLGLLAELAEYLAVQRFSLRYGGDNWTFVGAIAGGIAGALGGSPVLVVGPLVGLVAGTFGGAVAVTFYRRRDLDASLRVGRGALLGRAAAVALKTLAGLVTLGVGAASLLIV